jgi:hypothetical protein
MTERDVARIEKDLGVVLPKHYRRFLIDHGAAVARVRRKQVAIPFFTTAKEIIAANKELRANPSLRDTNRDTEPWPLKYLIVGSNGSDDWCVDLTNDREIIWLFDSEAYGTFRHATPASWGEYLAQMNSQHVPEQLPPRAFVCKKGVLMADAAGDGSFAVHDNRGRDWLCFERKEMNQEELLALVRGELRMPAWLGEKGLRNLTCTSIDELRECLSQQR